MLPRKAQAVLEYMRCRAPLRGGFMFEHARTLYDAGQYYDPILDGLLSVGAIAPHKDSANGWVVCVSYDNK